MCTIKCLHFINDDFFIASEVAPPTYTVYFRTNSIVGKVAIWVRYRIMPKIYFPSICNQFEEINYLFNLKHYFGS